MKKILLITFAILLVFGEIAAQKNAIRLGIPALSYGRFNLSYEHVLGTNKSINILVGAQVPRNFPGLVDEFDTEGDFRVNTATWKAAGITPSIRFYPKKSKEAPSGFYLAPFVGYNRNALILDSEYDDGQLSNIPATIETKLHGFNAGIMLGSQWIINEHVAIDFNYFGIGFGRLNIHSKFKSSDKTVDYQELADDFNEEIENEDNPGFNSNNVTTEVGADFFKIKTGTFTPVFKFSFAIGYAF